MVTPNIDKIYWHHGICDMCNVKHIVVCHFGYDVQDRK